MRTRAPGFTLVEILIAMMIMAAGVMLLANSWSGSFMRIQKTQVNVEIAALLERKMVETEIKYRGKPLESIEEEAADDFGSDYPQYRWTMESKEFELPDLSAGLTSRDGGANQTLLQVMQKLTEHLKKTIKEVKVTVFYKPTNGKKEISASATMVFIDYDKEIQVPGL